MSDVTEAQDDDAAVTGPASDAKAIKKKEKASERAERIANEDLQAIMSTPRGRRFMWRLLADTHVLHSSFRHGDPATSTAFREGERNIGVQLIDRLHRTCADLYAVMVRETSETDQ